MSNDPDVRTTERRISAHLQRRIRLQELKREISIGVQQLENGQGETYKSATALIDHMKAEGRKRRAAVIKGVELFL